MPDHLSSPDPVVRTTQPPHQGQRSVRETEFFVESGSSFRVRNRLAMQDIADGLKLMRLGCTLGLLDIKGRYRGSMLGPFWMTLSTAVMVLALGLLYSQLLGQTVAQFLPYLSLSLVLWGFLQNIIQDGCAVFTSSEGMIRAVRMPFFVHATRSIIRNLVILAHNMLVFIAVFAFFRIWPGEAVFGAIPALLLWLIDGYALTIMMGILCARFRDVPPIVSNLVQIGFYITPIIWKPEQLLYGRDYLPLNPFYAMLAVLRDPFLGLTPSWQVWTSALVYSTLLCIGSWFLFARVRGRIAFWI
ncbi:Polysaccharide export ABC transporter permease protein [Granulibacter bethesdensis]|uniref:Polysaccharide export ABC transporter permease protein n=2 Tax=Granulibacter bethesdensis TaxID=364410 RepID=Q0BR36_GRABC|nr:Polysaccharide export ABC transporter permease protein [Granulibacter bethesdensis CGDNIH1]AHJ63692.1 Polysaccharide export ABC transporter permease protein [Granulibacter bethesdensis]AHJ68342.1 Polysaccharide export ABC transporter permease protein [Granulibacter bethesdensis]APH52575.1 Polysaccharide export ABC transporter permease protein [Granulibacter bethesdensis]APH65264.1 Polysaccharide export ABC transporter permease protein [Granulibacter bethesdensis]